MFHFLNSIFYIVFSTWFCTFQIEDRTEKTWLDEQSNEEATLLSLPPAEALKYILCGLPQFSINECKELSKEHNSKEFKNEQFVKPEIPTITKTSFKNMSCHLEDENKSFQNDKKTLRNGSPKIVPDSDLKNHAVSIQNVDYTNKSKEEKDDVFYENEITRNAKCLNNRSLNKSCATEDENKIGIQKPKPLENSLHKEDLALSQSENLSPEENSLSQKNQASGVTSHQKLKVLKSSGTNSSAYLQDYLQLLTSRFNYTNVGKMKKGCESLSDPSLERRGSVPSLSSKKNSTTIRQRNASGSSDKSNLRSLGSTYLDSYLGNLTDHSWIIYPTGENDSDSSLKSNNKKISQTSLSLSPGSKNGEHMNRRLHFINPEKFFSIMLDKNKKELSETTSNAHVIKSNSSAENDHDLGLTDTSGIVMSPDISASSLDTDKFDSSHALSTSLQETPVLEECQSNKENEENTVTLTRDSGLYSINEKSSEKSMNDQKNNDISRSETNPLKAPSLLDKKITKRDHLSFKSDDTNFNNIAKRDYQEPIELKNVEYQEQDVLNSEESSITTTDDAEDQVSMIVCNNQNISVAEPGECHSYLYDKSKPTEGGLSVEMSNKKNDEFHFLQNCEPSEILNDNFEIDISISKLINMLKVKHEEELQALKNRQQQEMNKFVYQLLQLTTNQRLALANNGSLNDVFSNLSGTMPPTCRTSEITPSINSEGHQHLLASQFNHTNLIPSFFLHEENQDTENEKRTDVSKISQIFSPLKNTAQNVKKNSVESISFNKNLLHKKLEDNPKSGLEIKCAISEENDENKKDCRKQTNFTQKEFEVGLDLVPTRESDGVPISLAVSGHSLMPLFSFIFYLYPLLLFISLFPHLSVQTLFTPLFFRQARKNFAVNQFSLIKRNKNRDSLILQYYPKYLVF